MQPSQDDDLFQLLVKAKLAGTKLLGGGYSFRSNEDAAWTALSVIGDWLKQNVDADQLVIHEAYNWYNALLHTGLLDAEREQLEARNLIAAIERMKGLTGGEPKNDEGRSTLA